MEGVERVIGKLEEFKSSAEKQFSHIESRFNRLEAKVETIQHFKWKVIGGSTALSIVLAAAINLTFKFLGLFK